MELPPTLQVYFQCNCLLILASILQLPLSYSQSKVKLKVDIYIYINQRTSRHRDLRAIPIPCHALLVGIVPSPFLKMASAIQKCGKLCPYSWCNGLRSRNTTQREDMHTAVLLGTILCCTLYIGTYIIYIYSYAQS